MSITIKDIARMAGTSYATVSRALNNRPGINLETRTRIKRIAEEAGYTPNGIAQGLVTKNSSTIGLIVPDISNPFFPEIARGIQEGADRRGFQIFLCDSDWSLDREKNILSALHRKRVDGFIVAPASEETGHFLETARKGHPVVFAAYNPGSVEHDFVVTDDFKGAYIAAEYLAKLGHLNIAYIGGSPVSRTDILRQAGFRAALAARGLEPRHGPSLRGSFRSESGYEAMNELLHSPETPSAVFAGNDLLALGAIQAIEEFGLEVPGNISVIGFDDISYASLHKIQLTTVRQAKHRIGELCFEILLERVEGRGGDEARQIILEPELVVRKTCKAYKG